MWEIWSKQAVKVIIVEPDLGRWNVSWDTYEVQEVENRACAQEPNRTGPWPRLVDAAMAHEVVIAPEDLVPKHHHKIQDLRGFPYRHLQEPW
jgi:hypothetical protein